MTALAASRDGNAGAEGAARDACHRPEQTLLYQIIEAHYPAFMAELAARDRTLPARVQREFDDYLTCGRLEHGSLRHIPVPHPCGRTSFVQIGNPADLSCGCAVPNTVPGWRLSRVRVCPVLPVGEAADEGSVRWFTSRCVTAST